MGGGTDGRWKATLWPAAGGTLNREHKAALSSLRGAPGAIPGHGSASGARNGTAVARHAATRAARAGRQDMCFMARRGSQETGQVQNLAWQRTRSLAPEGLPAGAAWSHFRSHLRGPSTEQSPLQGQAAMRRMTATTRLTASATSASSSPSAITRISGSVPDWRGSAAAAVRRALLAVGDRRQHRTCQRRGRRRNAHCAAAAAAARTAADFARRRSGADQHGEHLQGRDQPVAGGRVSDRMTWPDCSPPRLKPSSRIASTT